MQEVLAASGQTQQVSFLNAISRSEKSCNACAQLKVLACRVSASQALQAQHTFIFASTCRVAVSPVLVAMSCGCCSVSQHLATPSVRLWQGQCQRILHVLKLA